jgi:hypothetical protein
VDGQDICPRRVVVPFYLQNPSWQQTGGENPQTAHAAVFTLTLNQVTHFMYGTQFQSLNEGNTLDQEILYERNNIIYSVKLRLGSQIMSEKCRKTFEHKRVALQ